VLGFEEALPVAKLVVRLAVRSKAQGSQASIERDFSLDELLRQRFPSLRMRRSAQRFTEQLADAVAGRLEPLINQEYRDVDDGERRAALALVVSVFRFATVDDETLFAAELSGERLAHLLLSRAASAQGGPRPSRELSANGQELFRLLLLETCEAYCRLVRRLPAFQPRAEAEQLERLALSVSQLEEIIRRLPVRSLYAPAGEEHDVRFRDEYLRVLSEELDDMELFYVAHDQAPSTPVSVAYISLSVRMAEAGTPSRALPHHANGAGGGPAGEERPTRQRVEAALGGSRRILVRGEAGSGKTTLLSWLAVSAARGELTGPLAGWNGLVPFMVKLRSYPDGALPLPDRLLFGATAMLASHMPPGWVDRHLRSGAALILVDGVDEIAEEFRPNIQQWVQRLLVAYPELRVVITSRPSTATESWLTAQGFTSMALDGMSPEDQELFVARWHTAVATRQDIPCDPLELPDYERSIGEQLRSRPDLRQLATNPLLTAMLCTLNLMKHQRLPRNRMEVYDTALRILLEERDAHRRIPAVGSVRLSYAEKICLLRNLAWRLAMADKTELRTSKAREYVARKLDGMSAVRNESPDEVFRHLLERSGVLREPSLGRLDFIHRTFQDYLAAQEFVAEDLTDHLVARAHLDQWRDVIILAVGQANTPQRSELLGELLNRAHDVPELQRHLAQLIVSCVETVNSATDNFIADVHSCVRMIMPPEDETEARTLALLGDALIPFLPDFIAGVGEEQAAATVRAAALTRTPGAQRMIGLYCADRRPAVLAEIIDSWRFFDAESYAREVLSQVDFSGVPLHIQDRLKLPHLHALQGLESLVLNLPVDEPAARQLVRCADLRHLRLREAAFESIAWVEALPGLQSLELGSQRPGPIADTEALSALTSLRNLTLRGWTGITLPPGAPFTDLRRLILDRVSGDFDLKALESARRLGELSLSADPQAGVGWTEEAEFPELKRLCLAGIGITPSPGLARSLPHLRSLALHGVPRAGVLDVAAFAAFPGLTEVELLGCGRVEGLTDLLNSPKIERLLLADLTGDIDASKLRAADPARGVTITVGANVHVGGLDRLDGRITVDHAQNAVSHAP
jgi:hypothetical protein